MNAPPSGKFPAGAILSILTQKELFQGDPFPSQSGTHDDIANPLIIFSSLPKYAFKLHTGLFHYSTGLGIIHVVTGAYPVYLHLAKEI